MKTLHKTAAVALALGMMFSSVPMTAMAANTVTVAAGELTQEQVIEKAKQYVSLPEGYEFRNASYQENGYGPYSKNGVWQISFTNENQRLHTWASVMIDAKTGQLLNFDIMDRDTTSFDQAISREDARTKVLEYMKKVAGDKMAHVQEIDLDSEFSKYSTQTQQQSFRFVRIVDGIPYQADGISVRVGANGRIVGYNYSWNDELKFPTATPAVTKEKAEEAFRQSLNLDLQYNRTMKAFSNEENYQLVYTPFGYNGMNNLPQIDANAGVAIGYDGKPTTPVQAEWTPLADKATGTLRKNVTKDEALEIIQAMNIVPEGYKVGNVYFDSQREYKSWRFDFQIGEPKDKDFNQMMVGIDAETGELQNMSNYGKYSGGEFPENPAVSVEQARQKAIDFVKKAMSTRIDKIAIIPTNQADMQKMGPSYGFTFVHLVDGLPLSNSTIRVMIDPTTGDVNDMYMERPSLKVKEVPKKADAMKVEEARAKYIEKYQLQLQYVPVYENQDGRYYEAPQKVTLVYAPVIGEQVLNLDAITGQWTMPWGGEPVEKAPITDIAGHWAEKQLQFFAERGIFEVKDGKVSPEANVSRGDMLRYLILSLNGPRMQAKSASFADVAKTSENFEFIEEAVARQWVNKTDQNFRPDDVITRQELSELITTVLGYQKLSETENTFKANFMDVNENNKRYFGDIAIVSSLGILTGSDGKFNPNQSVNRAQAAIVLTRVLDQFRNNIINYNYYY